MVTTQSIKLKTKGFCDIHDITGRVEDLVSESGVKNGTVTVFVPVSTGALTAVEHEPGLLKDIPEFMEKIIPSDRAYEHDKTWHDGNGFSHLRAALIGPDITVPIVAGRLTRGTWQQIIFLDFDNKSRQRELVVQIMGE